MEVPETLLVTRLTSAYQPLPIHGGLIHMPGSMPRAQLGTQSCEMVLEVSSFCRNVNCFQNWPKVPKMDSEGKETGRNWEARWVHTPTASKLEDKHWSCMVRTVRYRGGRHPHPH